MRVIASNKFIKFKKKTIKKLQIELDNQIKEIIKNNTLYLYSIGSHQNYYKNLKRFLKDMQKNK